MAKKDKSKASEAETHNNEGEEPRPDPQKKEGALDFPVVGIGASAGGLEALQEFFKHAPTDAGIAFVVVQHLSPDYKSMMDSLLARYTKLAIYRVEDGMEVAPDSIYLIPPRKNMSLFHGKLYLSEQEGQRPLNMPIDIFLRSLAKDQGNNAIGIILSGTGSDGTLGIRAIKEHAGMVIVQDDHSAKFDGMPRSSIATGIVDYILNPEKMPGELVNYLQHPFISKSEKLEEHTDKQNYLSKIAMLLRDKTGVDFSYYKENTILRRLEKRVSINQFNNIQEYIEFLSKDERELIILYKELLIGVTRFFRDEKAFEQLKAKVFPKIIENKEQGSQLRVWVAGCSTGEEAYSLAILLKEYMEEHKLHINTKIFATDLDKESIEFAGAGIYSESIISDISADWLFKYFTKKKDRYQVNENIRNMVVFASHNILRDPPFSRIDLVTCRNLLIYLKPKIQQKLLSMFYYALIQKGFLFLGSSEAVGEMSKGFKTYDSKSKIFQYVPGYQQVIGSSFTIPPQRTEKEKWNNAGKAAPSGIKRNRRLEKVFDELLGQFVPPSVILDENFQVVHTLHNVSKFLQIPVGQVTFEVLKMLPGELSILVSSMLHKIQKEKGPVVYENIELPQEKEQPVVVDITGQLIADQQSQESYYVISFQEKGQVRKSLQQQPDTETVDVNNQYQERILELEKELQYTKESLQATNEELETSNEELQSSNEELIASNEELQSTNEELQSVNEELYTVNSEYQNKIEELTELNNDMHNLLRNTKIGTLFLDKDLKIRKFTEIVPEITNIREMDIGRPIRHLSVDRIYSDFLKDIDYVVDTLKMRETEIQDQKENWYLVRIQPYRTDENAVNGIIVTFIDFTTLKKAREKVNQLNQRLENAMNMGNLAWWEWHYPSNTVYFGDQKALMLGYDVEETGTDFQFWANKLHPDDYEPTMQSIRNHLKGQTTTYEAEYRIKAKDGTWKWFKDRGGIVHRDKDGYIETIMGIVMDITREKAFELEKQRSYELIYKTLEYNPVASTIVDKDGYLSFANQKARDLFGISQEQIKNRTFDDSAWKNTDEHGREIAPDNLPFSKIMQTGKPIYRYRHYIEVPGQNKVLLSINGAPMFDAQGNISGVVFILNDITRET